MVNEPRPYNVNEITLLTSFYSGTINSNWSGFTLYPEDEYFSNPFVEQYTVLTGPSGDVYYAGDVRYSGDYSNLTFANSDYAREIHTFIHEGWHQVQSMHMSTVTYIAVVAEDAKEGNYNYEEVFGGNGTPFYKLSSEQQAEFFADYYLIKNGGAYYLDYTKGKYGNVAVHTLSEYDAVYNSVVAAGLDQTVTKTAVYEAQKDNKDRDNSDGGGQAMPAGNDDVDHDGATVNNSLIESALQIFKTSMNFASPLILDIDGDGTELVSLHSSSAVYFNVDSAKSDGVAEATGWFSGGDGALCIDLNGDGIINSSGELFGNQTGYANGFLALKSYDSNNDGFITSLDASWGNLRVWIESDVDGVSESQELHTLSSLSISSINLAYSDVNYTVSDNLIKQTSTFTINGNVRNIVDAYFLYSDHNTINNAAYDFDYRALNSPELRGYGSLVDLTIAEMRSNTGSGNLLDTVATLDAKTFDQLFDSTSTLKTDIRNILFKWAGVDGVSPTSRGEFVNGQELAFLEKLTGQQFLQKGVSEIPYGIEAGYSIQESFSIVFNSFYARLVAQVSGGQLFTGEWSYNVAKDSFSGITGLDTTKLNDLKTEALALGTSAARETFWENVVRMIEYSVGTANLPTASLTALQNAITQSDATLSLSGTVLPGLVFHRPAGVDESGTTGADVLTGSSGDDVLYALEGNDTINGLAGNDNIQAGTGDDTLNGATGGDYLLGQSGNDTYTYNVGDGSDTIAESGTGTGNIDDKILFGAGITVSSLTFQRLGDSALQITIGGATPGQIVIEGQFSNSGSVEKLQFSDGSVYTLTDKTYTSIGTSQNDTINGIAFGGANTDLIYLNGGDDTSYAGAGNDTVYGGDGNDKIYGEAGNDILSGEAGNDTLSGEGGNDSYYYSSGNDIFSESASASSTDEIVMASGITAGALSFARINAYDLKIDVAGYGSITVKDQFFNSSGSYALETIRFADNSTINLYTQSYITKGTGANDSLSGITGGGSTTDTFYLYEGNDNVSAGAGNDTVYAGIGNDIIYGEAGDDVVYGEDGDDILWGGAGNDTLSAGIGNDKLYGETGNDIYIYSGGNDIFSEGGSYSSTDEIRMASGITAANLSFARSGAYDLIITVSGYGSITIKDQFFNSSGSYSLETIRFTDNSTIDLLSQVYITQGTSGVDNLSGIAGGGSINDIIYLLDGNDTGSGGTGNDTIYGGNGNDTLNGDAGNDLLYGGLGDDVINGGADTDTVSYSDAAAAVTVNLATTTAQNTVGAGTDTISTVENIIGSAYNDTLTGNTGANVIEGGAGNDVMNGAAGVDTVSYASATAAVTVNLATTTAQNTVGAGTDTITAFENILGSAYNDTLTGDANANTIEGGAGNDVMSGAAGVDTVSYASATAAVTVNLATTTAQNTVGAGTDTITAFENILGSIYADTLRGDANVNIVWAGAGNDFIQSGWGNDTVYCDVGDDYVIADVGNDWASGGAGSDLVDLSDGDDTGYGGDGNDTVGGGQGNDFVYGDAGNDLLYGGDGTDRVEGGDGDDYLEGGAGNDTLIGGVGIDTLSYLASTAAVTVNLATTTAQNTVGAGTDTITTCENILGSAYNDTLTGNTGANVIEGGTGNDIMNGGAGVDTVSYSSATAAVTVNLATTTAQNTVGAGTDTITAFENIIGSAYADTLRGDSNVNSIWSGSGNDFIQSGWGNDTVYCEAGDDYVIADVGNDWASGGDGNDTVDVSDGDDTGFGDAGDDTVGGGQGNDYVDGGSGNDLVYGGTENDILIGGLGADTLTGGTGVDTFWFTLSGFDTNIDHVADFSTVEGDKIDLKELLVGYDPVTKAITDFVEFTTVGADTVVKVDRDGTGSTYGWQQIATLDNVTGLTDEAALKTSGNLIVA